MRIRSAAPAATSPRPIDTSAASSRPVVGSEPGEADSSPSLGTSSPGLTTSSPVLGSSPSPVGSSCPGRSSPGRVVGGVSSWARCRQTGADDPLAWPPRPLRSLATGPCATRSRPAPGVAERARPRSDAGAAGASPSASRASQRSDARSESHRGRVSSAGAGSPRPCKRPGRAMLRRALYVRPRAPAPALPWPGVRWRSGDDAAAPPPARAAPAGRLRPLLAGPGRAGARDAALAAARRGHLRAADVGLLRPLRHARRRPRRAAAPRCRVRLPDPRRPRARARRAADHVRLQRALGREDEVGPPRLALSAVHWSWFLVPHGTLAYILLRHRDRFPRSAVLMARLLRPRAASSTGLCRRRRRGGPAQNGQHAARAADHGRGGRALLGTPLATRFTIRWKATRSPPCPHSTSAHP